MILQRLFWIVIVAVVCLSPGAEAQPDPEFLWTRTYGGKRDDVARAVDQTSDGGYVLVGYTKCFGAGRQDFYLVRTGPDAQGNEEGAISR